MTIETATMTDNPVAGCGCAACRSAQKAEISDLVPVAIGSESAAHNLQSGNVWPVNTGGTTTLTYKFLDSIPSYYTNGDTERSGFLAFNNQMRDAGRRIFDQIETFARIDFSEQGSTILPQNTQITLGSTTLPLNVGAWAYYPDQTNAKGGDVWLNHLHSGTQTPVEGNYGFYVLMHEIGHSIGLQHSFNVFGGAEATSQFSVMAYDWSPGYSTTYQLYDIAAIQDLYGANMSYRTGDDIYTLRSGELYTVWDAGGTDTFSAAHMSTAVTIDLNDGEFSSVGGTDNIAIAYNAVIENAAGGLGNDTIIGNSASNILLGGLGNDTFIGSAGNDTIRGESGTDRVNYSFDIARFFVNVVDAVTVTVQDSLGTLGTDTLISIERFFFNAIEYSLDAFTSNNAPVVSVTDTSLSQNEVVMASSVLSVTDADDDALTYTLWDSYGAASSAFFRLDGDKLAGGQNHVLSQAEFDRLEIVGGTAAFEDKLWIQVTDGLETTSWFSATVTTTNNSGIGSGGGSGGGGGANVAPVVSVSDTTLATSEAVLASSVMSATDANGDAITYTLWDSYGAGSSAFFRLDGVKLGAGQNLVLSQAEFDRLEIVGGTAAFEDKLWIQVTDGNTDTSWFVSNVTTSAASGGGSGSGSGGSGGGANVAPVITTSNATLATGEVVQASTLMSATDANSDDLTYTLWDSYGAGNSAFFRLDGVKLAAGQNLVLSQAEFDRLEIVGGSGDFADKLWIQVSDGTVTTSWYVSDVTTSSTAIAAEEISLYGQDEIEGALAAISADTVSSEGGSDSFVIDSDDVLYGEDLSEIQNTIDSYLGDTHSAGVGHVMDTPDTANSLLDIVTPSQDDILFNIDSIA